MFNVIDIYSFIPVSGCVGMGTSTLLFPVAYSAVKRAPVLSCDVLLPGHTILTYLALSSSL